MDLQIKDLKISENVIIEFRNSLVLDEEKGVYIDKSGNPIYLYNCGAQFLVLYGLYHNYGRYGKVILTDHAVTEDKTIASDEIDETMDNNQLSIQAFKSSLADTLDTLAKFNVYRESDPLKTINFKNRLAVFDYVDVQKYGMIKILKEEAVTYYCGITHEKCDIPPEDIIPLYVYIDNLNSYTDFKRLNEELIQSRISTIIIFYNKQQYLDNRESFVDGGDLSSLDKFTGDYYILSESLSELKDLKEVEMHTSEARVLSAYSAVMNMCQYLAEQPQEYYYVSKYIDVSDELLLDAFAYSYYVSGKKPEICSDIGQRCYIWKLIRYSACDYGSICDRLQRFALMYPDDDAEKEIISSLRLYMDDISSAIMLCRVTSARPNLKYRVVKWNLLKSCIDSNGFVRKDVDRLNLSGVSSYSQAEVNIFEDRADVISRLIDPLVLFGLDKLDNSDNSSTKQISYTGNYAYSAMRLIDQFCTKYELFTTLRDVIAFTDVQGEVYLGYATLDPQLTADVYRLCTPVQIAKNIPIGYNTIDTKSLYGFKQGDSVDVGIWNDIAQAYGYPNQTIPDIYDSDIPQPTPLQLQMGVWNSCTRYSNASFKGNKFCYMNLGSSYNYNCCKIFLPSLFRQIKPFGFSELTQELSPINLYGGIQKSNGEDIDNVLLWRNLFKSVPHLGDYI
jgi:hypothetical protein